MLRMLGYFALTGLMRVHCLVGDYFTALKVRGRARAVLGGAGARRCRWAGRRGDVGTMRWET